MSVWCRNSRCKWNGTSWPVEVREDGSIPDPITSRPKSMIELPSEHERGVVDALQAQYEATMRSGGAEIRR